MLVWEDIPGISLDLRFRVGATEIIDRFNFFIAAHNLSSLVLADHISLKCESSEFYEKMRAHFESEKYGKYMHQSIISGRRISIIKLQQPLHTLVHAIQFLELSDQKPDGSQKRSFDHVEYFPVIRSTYESFATRLAQTTNGRDKGRAHHRTFDVDIGEGLEARLEREPLIEKIKRDEMI